MHWRTGLSVALAVEVQQGLTCLFLIEARLRAALVPALVQVQLELLEARARRELRVPLRVDLDAGVHGPGDARMAALARLCRVALASARQQRARQRDKRPEKENWKERTRPPQDPRVD